MKFGSKIKFVLLLLFVIHFMLPCFKAQNRCDSDVDCNNQTHFCNESFICAPCINCTRFNRDTTTNLCAKNVSNGCGDCLPGYGMDGTDTCYYIYKDNTPYIAIIVGAVTLSISVIAILACIVAYFIVTCVEKRKRKNKKPEQESTPALHELNTEPIPENDGNFYVQSAEARQKL